MAAEPDRQLVPDQEILDNILPGHEVLLKDGEIISNTFNTCTFRVRHLSTNLLIRLEGPDGAENQSSHVVIIQRLARRLTSDDMVLDVRASGLIKHTDGRRIEYTVTEFLIRTVTLEEVWNELDPTNQEIIVSTIVSTIQRLQQKRTFPYSQDEEFKDAMRSAPTLKIQGHASRWSPETPMGSPSIGYFSDIASLLKAMFHDQKGCTFAVDERTHGVVLKSDYEDMGQVEFTSVDLTVLRDHVVLCHHDLEPRNVLVRKKEVIETINDGAQQPKAIYEVVSLIDWESAGFFPFAFEYGYKDTVLGTSNLTFTWYAIFKKMSAHLLPEGEAHTKLIRALLIAHESRTRVSARNVGFRVQKKWIEREQIERATDVRVGWVRKRDVTSALAPFTIKDKEDLETDVLKELGYI